MSNRHNNQRENTPESRQDARAPYNFVPLPERAVDVREQPGIVTVDDALPSHNVFRSDRRHGYFDITLTTESPLYIRGMLTRNEAVDKEKHRNKPDFFHTGDPAAPVIPGSSLRGMIRTLLEIVTWSKVARVTKRQLFYRTVDDSVLGKEYSSRMTGNVEAGFLQQSGTTSFITRSTLLRVDRQRLVADVTNPVELYEGNGQNWTPRWRPDGNYRWYQYMRVWVTSSNGKNVDEIRPMEVTEVGWYPGILVITGNMPGIDRRTNRPKKQREFVFLLPSTDAERIEVPQDMLERFHDDDQITQWQEKAFPTDKPRPDSRKRKGMLVAQPKSYENPVFFLRENNTLVFSGRAGMFRLPYRNSPTSLIPAELRNPDQLDFSEAMFGYVRFEKRGHGIQGDKESAYAGRVSISDAKMITHSDDPYDIDAGGVTPPILGTPKPTAFQHYLVQPKTDDPKKFIHYDGTNASIRGHKLYWRQRREATSDIPGSTTAPLDPSDTQRTRMRPIKKGVQFTFRIDFENLTDVELGALAWVLALGSDNHHPNARHMLGMGKPFGIGVVKLDAALVFRDRKRRYTSLFSNTGWSSGDAQVSHSVYLQAFETFMTEQRNIRFNARIAELLSLLTVRNEHELNNEMFSNMTLEDFKKRSVLRPASIIGEEYDTALKSKLDGIRAAEFERQKAEKRARGIEVGDVIRGKVAEKPKYDDEDVVIDRLNVSDGRKYVACFMAQHRRREEQIQKDQDITLFVLEVEQSDDGYTYLWCRRATKEERQK